MSGAARLAPLLALCVGRSAAAQGLNELDLALLLHPYTREALYTLETINAQTAPGPESKVEPGAVLESFMEMLRGHFRTVTLLEGDAEAASGRFHLVYTLDLHLEIGLKSGDKTEVHAAAHITRPDGSKLEYINVDAVRIVPMPATGSNLREAVREARDKTDKALRGSARLAAYAAGLPAAAGRPPARAPDISSGTEGGREIVWVRIPGGSFRMGSERDGERPIHRVTVKSFSLSKTEVTFRQYRACVRAGGCGPPHDSDGTCYQRTGSSWMHGNLPPEFSGEEQPVVCVDWTQARAFAKWAGGRLPSEAEWEYAARGAGKDQEFPWGDGAPSCERGVMFDGEDGCGRKAPWPVCSKPLGNTEQGLCDMAGNVFEWVSDRDHPSYHGAPADASAWEDGDSHTRVRRGGSWATSPAGMRAAFRLRDRPEFRFSSVGFRVAR